MINTYGLKVGDWIRYRDPIAGKVTHLQVWLVKGSDTGYGPRIHAHQGPGRFGIVFDHGASIYRHLRPVAPPEPIDWRDFILVG